MQLTQKKSRRGDLLTAAAVAMLLAVMAALLYTGSLTRQVTNMLIPTAVYIVMAVSLNLVVGLLGELSLGHAGFMSVGLFSGCLVAIALTNTALPLMLRLPVSMLAGGLTAAVFGLLVGLPTLRLRGDYLAIVTLACGEIIKNKGATFYAVTVSVCRLCSMLLSAYNSIVTVSTMMHGEYGLEDVCISTLDIVGPNGVQGKLPVRLTEDEMQKLHASADKLKETIGQIYFEA